MKVIILEVLKKRMSLYFLTLKLKSRIMVNVIFLIHTFGKRRWYVDEFLVPSLLRSGASYDQIYIYEDPGDGNLIACLKSFIYYGQIFPGEKIWNLQDDILLCRDFAKRCTSLSYEHDIVLGFCSSFGTRTIHNNLCWSMPCIMLPGSVMSDISDYFWSEVRTNSRYQDFMRNRYCDDVVVNDYIGKLIESGKATDIYKAIPSLVEHVDFLLGGSLINKGRQCNSMATNFRDMDLVEALRSDIYKFRKERFGDEMC